MQTIPCTWLGIVTKSIPAVSGLDFVVQRHTLLTIALICGSSKMQALPWVQDGDEVRPQRCVIILGQSDGVAVLWLRLDHDAPPPTRDSAPRPRSTRPAP